VTERVAWWFRAANRMMDPAAPRVRGASGASFAALQARAAARSRVTEPADPRFLADLRILHASFLSVPELSFTGLTGIRAELHASDHPIRRM
jgi:hypothetical protein